MTCHVAISGADHAVVFADSQGTIPTEGSETHGAQKLFAGIGFLVGFAGSMLVGHELFGFLRREESARRLRSENAARKVREFFECHVDPSFLTQIQCYVVTRDADGWIRSFYPGVLKRFMDPQAFASLGSGAPFVQRTYRHFSQLGVGLNTESISKSVVTAVRLIQASDESLTVDGTYLAGLLYNGKSYVLGDENIAVRTGAPGQIVTSWPAAASRFKAIKAQCEAIIAEIREAFRSISGISRANLDPTAVAQLPSKNASVTLGYGHLQASIDDYCAWYDGKIGRA